MKITITVSDNITNQATVDDLDIGTVFTLPNDTQKFIRQYDSILILHPSNNGFQVYTTGWCRTDKSSIWCRTDYQIVGKMEFKVED